MLAAATFAILVVGPVIIGYIPIMVVGALIFFLGFDLLREALVDTWGRVHRLEYLTVGCKSAQLVPKADCTQIIIIVITMGAWDFVMGILVGILLACVSFVLQTSRVSAIRGQLPGGVANSTVRRHPIQHRFLKNAGQQTHVMKLAGYLFFGTIVGVEKHIRNLLLEQFQSRPIRYLVLDLYNVDGVDFSAAEAFTRINRILKIKGVELVICGITMEGEVGTSLCNVGLFNEDDGALYCESLNSALEYCENELLKAFYQQQTTEPERESAPNFLGRSSFSHRLQKCLSYLRNSQTQSSLLSRNIVQLAAPEPPSSSRYQYTREFHPSHQMAESQPTPPTNPTDLLSSLRTARVVLARSRPLLHSPYLPREQHSLSTR